MEKLNSNIVFGSVIGDVVTQRYYILLHMYIYVNVHTL